MSFDLELVGTPGGTGPCAGQPNGSACSDGNACTTADTCQGGSCAAGTAVNCDDGNGCTTDSCDATLGCTHANSAAPCDSDDDACTQDTCSQGACVPGAAKVCDDADACTDDSCNSQTGLCAFTANGDPGCAPPPTGVFIAKGSAWRYRDDGSNQGTAWRAKTFVDTGWKLGDAQLGYGDGDEATVVSFGPSASSKFVTTYFRRSFTLSAAPTQPINLALLRDDGAGVAWTSSSRRGRRVKAGGCPRRRSGSSPPGPAPSGSATGPWTRWRGGAATAAATRTPSAARRPTLSGCMT